MKERVWIMLSCCLFSMASQGYELNGTMADNSDGTFTVVLSDNENEEEDTYYGTAVMQGDGTITLSVVKEAGGVETYIGTGIPDQNGSYTLHLRNNSSGRSASGVVTPD